MLHPPVDRDRLDLLARETRISLGNLESIALALESTGHPETADLVRREVAEIRPIVGLVLDRPEPFELFNPCLPAEAATGSEAA